MASTINNWITFMGVVVDVVFGRWICRKVGPLQGVGESNLKGKTILVTGPTSGIGRDTAKELIRRGAHVVLACRNTAAGEKLVEEWRLDCKLEEQEASTEVIQLDLSSLQSVRECAEKLNSRSLTLDVLIGNAGIFSMSGPREVTKDGFEAHFGCNYLGHFLLTLLLLPALRRSKEGGRVVMVSSKLHEFGDFDWDDLQIQKGYSSHRAYGQSKLAQIIFGYELQRRCPQLKCVSVHPGNVLTEVVRTLPGAVQWLYRFTMRNILLSPPEGARASVFAATAPLSQIIGGYIVPSLNAVQSKRSSYDGKLASRLWTESLKLVDLPADFNTNV